MRGSRVRVRILARASVTVRPAAAAAAAAAGSTLRAWDKSRSTAATQDVRPCYDISVLCTTLVRRVYPNHHNMCAEREGAESHRSHRENTRKKESKTENRKSACYISKYLLDHEKGG